MKELYLPQASNEGGREDESLRFNNTLAVYLIENNSGS